MFILILCLSYSYMFLLLRLLTRDLVERISSTQAQAYQFTF
jgi:hypothetical protein